MQFELTQVLIDEILFYMEDQNGKFLLDTQKGIIVNTESGEFVADDDDRYISLPEWEPSDGFRLMERFAAGLHNALVREELSAALDRGRGVFRAFKNTLSQYPEAEKLWHGYKNREMKREVIAWYNSLREEWGLELIGEEPEDISGLALEDFRFRPGELKDKTCAEDLHRACLTEFDTKFGTNEPQFNTKFNPKLGYNFAPNLGMGEWAFPGDLCCVAETSGGEFAGYICAVHIGDVLRICAVEVLPEYRGLGLAQALIARLLEQADNEKITQVIIDLPAGQEHFARALLRESFKPCVQRYCRYPTTS